MAQVKVFIGCLIAIAIGVSILLFNLITITVIVVDDAVTENHRTNLLVLYNIRDD